MRRPAVAGGFYEAEKGRLEAQLKECFAGVVRAEKEREVKRERAGVLGAVVPHAGYFYSGSVAAAVYAKLPNTETETTYTFVILGPNHHGLGSPVAVSTETWVTPLGEVEVDRAFVDALPKRIIDLDETAHKYEHSVEVQLPFLQFLFGKKFQFVPVCVGLSDEETAREVGEDLAETVETVAEFGENKKIVVVASSDFTHYEPDRVAREKDKYVIEAVTELDVPKFYKRVYERNVTACGVGPIAAMLHAAKKLGATTGELVKYATSGDATGDKSNVVGYGGVVIFK